MAGAIFQIYGCELESPLISRVEAICNRILHVSRRTLARPGEEGPAELPALAQD